MYLALQWCATTRTAHSTPHSAAVASSPHQPASSPSHRAFQFNLTARLWLRVPGGWALQWYAITPMGRSIILSTMMVLREIPPGFEVLRSNVAWGVALQADGKILVVGESADHSQNIGTDDFLLLRYNPDGSLDSTFDGDGLVLTAFAIRQNSARDIVVQPDGKILAAGPSFQDNGSVVAIARYNTDGSLDTSFDSDGIVVGATNSSDRYIANALA